MRPAGPPRPRSGLYRSGNRNPATASPGRWRLSGFRLRFAGLGAWLVDVHGQWSRRHRGRLFGVVGQADEVEVFRRHRAASEYDIPHPFQQAAPVLGAKQDDREMLDLPGLRQRQRFEELVERPEAAWKDDEAARVLHEHVLAHEEVAELDAQVDVWVELLLARQLDVAAHRQPTGLVAAAVHGFHHSWPAAGDDSEAATGKCGA